MNAERESIPFDVLFVGGGPASLAGAIQLMQSAAAAGVQLEAALIEKGSEIGAHGISGAVLNPAALAELIPDYREKDCPIEATVREDAMVYLTSNRHFRLPFIPRYLHNRGFHVVSLSKFTRWLGQIAEELGVNVFPGFAGSEVLFDADGRTVAGVRTGDKGLDKDGGRKGTFEAGIDLTARVTLFGEGARGSLTRDLQKRLHISEGRMPQVFETGIKEVIQLPQDHYFSRSRENCIHLMGYPLGLRTPGGGFIYEMSENRLTLGFLTALSYEDTATDLYDLFIQFKRHPFVSRLIADGKVLQQGARTVSTGGYYTMPRLLFNGGMLIGGAAGIQNTPALKGIHVSMKSGMLAAQAVVEAFAGGSFDTRKLAAYPRWMETGWIKDELYQGRNFAQALAKPPLTKLIHLGAQYVTRGRGLQDKMPLTADHRHLKPAEKPVPSAAASPTDGVLYLDKLTGVYLSKTHHREDQPSHLIIHDPDVCIRRCIPTFQAPCVRFCPGGVYELAAKEDGGPPIKLNPSNCLHCKTCEIKDPFENITWTCPEGGDGPEYTLL